MSEFAANLSEYQREALMMFEEITQIQNQQLCIQILDQNSWNVDVAVDNFVQGRGTEASALNRSRPIRNDSTSNDNQLSDTITSTTSPTTSTIAPQPSSFLETLITPLKWLFQTRRVSLDPNADTQIFLSEFEQLYGSDHPTLHNQSYQSAVVSAFQQSKFLLVYLHSPMHEDTEKFCTQTFCSENFTHFVNENMMTWAGKVWDPEAYGLSVQLRVSSFPFLAVLLCQSDKVVQVIDRIDGFAEEDALTERLQASMQTHRSTLTRIQTEAARRVESTMLREQQDREYREAEEADRVRRETMEREAIEAQQREEEEEQRRELEEAIDLSNKLTKESNIIRKRQSLAGEPNPTVPVSEVSTIRFQLPQGSKISRRFMKTDPVQTVCDYLLVYFYDQQLDISNISLATHFPKVELSDMTQTVEAAGLHPRGMLYVQNLDA